METTAEIAAYAVGGFLLPGFISASAMAVAPESNAELRSKLGKIGLLSVVAGIIATMATGDRTKAAGMGVAIGGALISLAAIRVPNSLAKPLTMGRFDPLIASMHLGVTELSPK